MTKYRISLLALLLAAGTGCDKLQALMGGGDTPEITKSADDKLKAGDIPGAVAEYEKIRKDKPDSVYAAEGEAYALLLEGDYAGADAALKDAEAKAKDKKDVNVGEIKLRRAIVALRAGKLDDVKAFGKDSNLPAGLVLAAEVHLADAESDDAIALLKQASSDGGIAGQTAKTYLDMLQSDDPTEQGLAEATALWALGQRSVAVESAEELVKALPEDKADKDEILLVWAGRAVTSGKPASAEGMLDAMGAPPEGQAWRVQATKAMIAIADGRNDEGVAIFTALASAGAPADGLADALATAAGLTKDKEVARTLAGSVESAAAARGLYEAGAGQAAKAVAPQGSFSKFLETK